MGLALPATAADYFSETFNSGFLNGGAIPDGSLNGWNDTRTVTGASGSWNINDVQVTLDLSGGYNGDLYAYLAHDNGFAVLLNRVGVGSAQGDGFGYANAGMNITLSSAGANGNIHWYGGANIPTGSYQPDGRAIDPLSPASLFDTADPRADFRTFIGEDPNGKWTLFLADVSAGGGESALLGWSLTVGAIPVPEPPPMTLAALVLGLSVLWRTMREKNCGWQKPRSNPSEAVALVRVSSKHVSHV